LIREPKPLFERGAEQGFAEISHVLQAGENPVRCDVRITNPRQRRNRCHPLSKGGFGAELLRLA